MGKEIKVRIIMRYNSTEGWASLSPGETLAKGEIGLEYIPGNTLPKMKIGDGSSSWNNLPYFETSLPKNFTWGNLRGTTLQTFSSKTENLSLTKPGFTDIVDIVSLNNNFKKIDDFYSLQSDNIKNLGARITDLGNKLSATPTDWNEISAEVEAAKTINGVTYDSLANALDALNHDLQSFKKELDDIIGQNIPSKLVMEENGMLYLADSAGEPIGEGTLVKDNKLAEEVADIRQRYGNEGTFISAGSAVRAIDAELQGIRTRERTGETKQYAKDVITEIDNELRIVDKEVIRLKEEVIPDGFIYSNNQLYLAVQNEPIGDPVEITGGGGGGGGSASFTISLSNEMDSRIFSVAENTPVILKFKYESLDNEGIDDGAGSGELLLDNIKILGFTVPQGTKELDITSFLQKGENNFKVKVINSEGSYRTLTYTITVLALSITSNFPEMGTYSQNSVAVQYTVSGEGTKTVYFILTKQVTNSEPQLLGTETLTSSGQSRQFTLNKPATSGAYILQIYATASAGQTIVFSNTISLGMIWYDAENDTSPFVLINTNQVSAIEGETIRIPYLVFHPSYPEISTNFTIIQRNVEEDGNIIPEKIYSTRSSTVNRTSKTWTIQSFPAGEVVFKISCGSTSSSVIMNITKSDFNKTIIQNGLLLEFNATGRQNSDDNKDQWEYNGYKAQFNNIGWTSIDGWYLRDKIGGEEGEKEEQTVLRLLPGSSMTIPFKPFEKDITQTGYTIEVEMATQNVSDYDSIIMDSFSEGRGFLIKSQSALLSSSGSSISAQFKQDEKVRLTFVVEQYTANRLVTIYINGVSCGIQQYSTSDIFSHPFGKEKGITIGAQTCGIDIYFIRFYNTAFSSTQQLNNFIVDRPTLAERIAKDRANNIINENSDNLSKKITINSLQGSIPYIIMECPELPQFKGDKKKGMSFSFVDPNNPERSFTAKNVQFDVQGTSSAGYPVKNFKLKLGKLEEGGGIIYTQSKEAAKGFKFRGDDSLITKVFCLKADYASSENTNNVMLVDYYNETCPYRNQAQQADERVRWGVYGEPIVLFWRNTKNNEIYFQGKYNMNDDKDNENIFGFVDILDEEKYPNIECWEFLNNNTALCLFSHVTDANNSAWFEKVTDDEGNTMDAWENAFERRFPEQDENTKNNLGNLQRMINWVASTNRNRAFNDIALSSEVYYKTLDKNYISTKEYYELIADGTFSLKTITLFDAIKVYDNKTTVLENVFSEAIKAIDPTLSLYQVWVCTPTDGGWKVAYISNEQENIVINQIEKLESIGISVGQDFSGQNVVFEYYLGNDWNNALYEKHTHDTPDYRLAKFKNEFKDYFEPNPVAYYYVFTETFLLMDSRAKNMFLMTFDGEHWFPSPYDMDTALGINNEGQLVFDYNLEDTDTSSHAMIYNGKDKLYDGTKTHTGSLNKETKIFTTNKGEQIQYDGSLVFNGQESVFWCNYRDCFGDEIASMYRGLRSQGGKKNGEKPFSYQDISMKMNNHQNAWPEVLWNIDQEIKYLQPFYAGINNLAMAQGNKQTQRDFWTFNTFKYRDSKYKTADSINNYIHLRLYDKGTISITPYSHIYARVEFGNAKDEQKRAFRNETVSFNTDGIATVNDLETHIFSSDRISKIGDLSPFRVGYCDFSMAPKLQEIIVGSEEPDYLNGNLTTFTLGASELLRLVNISNCYNLKGTIDASRCPTLQTFKAKGSAITGVNFSVGGRLKEFYLPKTITNLTLREQNQLTIQGINVETNDDGTYNLINIWIDNSPIVPFYQFIINSPKLEYLRLTNINWVTTKEELLNFYNIASNPAMGSLTETGASVSGGGAVVTGKVYVDSIDGEFLAQLNQTFPNLTVYVNGIPKYFVRYVTYDNKLLYSYLAEGDDPAIDPTSDSSVPEQLRKSILDTIRIRPAIDSNHDNVEDTFFELDENTVWEDLPTEIKQSYTIVPKYIIKYLTRYYQEGVLLYQTTTIRENMPIDPVQNGEIAEIPFKEITAQYNYTYNGWNPKLYPLTGPQDFEVNFIEKVNSYIVKFFSGEKELKQYEQNVDYNSPANMPPSSEVFKFFLDKNGEYQYYEIYEHIGWDIYNDGIIDIDFINDPEKGIIIKPLEYTTQPIKIYAVFSSIEPITDSWKAIINSCEDGSYKEKYPVGTQKMVKFTYQNNTYDGLIEVVEQNKDIIFNSETDTAPLTFILKNIFTATNFRSNSSFVWIDDNGNEIKGSTAGGWSNSPFYSDIQNITFIDAFEGDRTDLLNESIKSVKKKTDFGPARTNAAAREYYPAKILSERIWTPSASELGVLPPTNTAPEAQQGDTYIWFTNNDSRIKKYFETPERYWTRTWEGTTAFRIYGVGFDGGYAYDISTTTPALGIMAFETAGLIFGFCI